MYKRQGETLSLGGAPYSQWLFFRSGRHKNDLPSVLCPAKVDGRYLDGIRGLTESGQEILSTEEPPLTLVSDELTLLRSPDACLTLSFLTGQSMLVGMELTSSPQRDGMERLEAIQYLDGVVLEPGECRVGEDVYKRQPKAYPAYFGSYSRFPAIRKWLDGFENLYCIGRNGQHRYNNMDHSMLTAIRAVDALEGKCSRSAVWEEMCIRDRADSPKLLAMPLRVVCEILSHSC